MFEWKECPCWWVSLLVGHLSVGEVEFGSVFSSAFRLLQLEGGAEGGTKGGAQLLLLGGGGTPLLHLLELGLQGCYLGRRAAGVWGKGRGFVCTVQMFACTKPHPK